MRSPQPTCRRRNSYERVGVNLAVASACVGSPRHNPHGVARGRRNPCGAAARHMGVVAARHMEAALSKLPTSEARRPPWTPKRAVSRLMAPSRHPTDDEIAHQRRDCRRRRSEVRRPHRPLPPPEAPPRGVADFRTWAKKQRGRIGFKTQLCWAKRGQDVPSRGHGFSLRAHRGTLGRAPHRPRSATRTDYTTGRRSRRTSS